MIKRLLLVTFLLTTFSCHEEVVPTPIALTGPKAVDRICLGLLNNASPIESQEIRHIIFDTYTFEGGSFNGSSIYMSFSCKTLDECLRAFELVTKHNRSNFSSWRKPSFDVTQHPPGLTDISTVKKSWDVSVVENGMVMENVEDAIERIVNGQEKFRIQRLFYGAIDSDNHKVFIHYESGGIIASLLNDE